jgi:hypothetical protein
VCATAAPAAAAQPGPAAAAARNIDGTSKCICGFFLITLNKQILHQEHGNYLHVNKSAIVIKFKYLLRQFSVCHSGSSCCLTARSSGRSSAEGSLPRAVAAARSAKSSLAFDLQDISKAASAQTF